MILELMSFEIDLRIEHHELLLQAFGVQTRKVVLAEMSLQRIVVKVVLRILSARSSITQMPSSILIAAVGVEFIITIASFAVEPTLWMTSESALIDGARVVIAILFMAPQFRLCE